MSNSSLIWEYLRKAFHLSSLLIVVGYTLLLLFTTERIAILSMTALLLILLEVEYVRLEHKPRIAAVLDGAFRKHEKDNISGAVFIVISCIICFAVFDYWIAFMALLMTVFGDLVSALMGKTFGKRKLYRNKTIIGTGSGLAANVIVGVLTLPSFLIVTIPMAITATITEMVTNKLDDNLTVPLFAGFLGQMIVIFFEIELPPIEFTLLGLF